MICEDVMNRENTNPEMAIKKHTIVLILNDFWINVKVCIRRDFG